MIVVLIDSILLWIFLFVMINLKDIVKKVIRGLNAGTRQRMKIVHKKM